MITEYSSSAVCGANGVSISVKAVMRLADGVDLGFGRVFGFDADVVDRVAKFHQCRDRRVELQRFKTVADTFDCLMRFLAELLRRSE